MSRRRVLASGLLAGGTLSFATHPVAAALMQTPRQTRGPFYPAEIPLDADSDLVLVEGQSRPAKGQVIHLIGRVFDSTCALIPEALVEIWQCDANGFYHHPGDRGGQADPGFQGYGRTFADSEGRYRFRTIKPLPYPGRTPHIHFQIASPSGQRLVTQMYLKDHPLNARDFIFNGIGGPQEKASVQVAFEAAPELGPDAEVGSFDIVLPSGSGG
jgi:protocatechuate 3,4-dioxygenase beta subunit